MGSRPCCRIPQYIGGCRPWVSETIVSSPDAIGGYRPHCCIIQHYTGGCGPWAAITVSNGWGLQTMGSCPGWVHGGSSPWVGVPDSPFCADANFSHQFFILLKIPLFVWVEFFWYSFSSLLMILIMQFGADAAVWYNCNMIIWDNIHKWHFLSKLLCKIGRHDYEGCGYSRGRRPRDSEKKFIFLKCFYCGKYKISTIDGKNGHN